MSNLHAFAIRAHSAARARGFTIVELMVAMLLGLIVIAGVSSVFLANLRSYHSNTALSNVQSNARIAFELMSRDIRQAGLTGCNSVNTHITNVLDNGPSGAATLAWWANWDNVVYGFDSTQTDTDIAGAMPARAASTDSLTVMEATGQGFTVASAATAPPSLTLADDDPPLQAGDIVIVCNPDHAAIMQVSAFNGAVLTHATGGSSPGNIAVGPNFTVNSKVSPLAVHHWYIGTHDVDGRSVRSLYRISLAQIDNVPTPTAYEMVRNVTDMQITYHQSGDPTFVDANEVTSWSSVDAVHIEFTMQSKAGGPRAGVGPSKVLTRTFASTTAIRNRNVTP